MRKLLVAIALLVGSVSFAQTVRYRVSAVNSSANFSISGALTLSGTTNPQIDCTGNATCQINSAKTATGSVDRAFKLRATQSLSGSDRILTLSNSSDAEVFAFLYGGNLSSVGGGWDLTASAGLTVDLAGFVAALSNRATGLYSAVNDAGLATAGSAFLLSAGNNLTTGKLLRVGDSGLGTFAEQFAVGFDGTLYQATVAKAFVETASAFSDLTATLDTPFGSHKVVTTGTAQTLTFTQQVPGVNGAGTGTAVLEIVNEAGTALCTLTAFACNAAAGTITSVDCSGGGTQPVAANSVRFQWDGTSDCAALPKGTADVSWK